MKSAYRETCTNYSYSHNKLLPKNCHSIEEYLAKSRMESSGSWGTDLELFLAAQILQTDIFVYRDCQHRWNKFSGHGFIDRQEIHKLTDKRIYFRLHLDHFQPVVKVESASNFRLMIDDATI